MGRWIEITTHRIYEVSCAEFYDNYEKRSQSGEHIEEGKISYHLVKKADGLFERGEQVSEAIYRVIRKSDSKVFKPAQFVPADILMRGCFYLEEA